MIFALRRYAFVSLYPLNNSPTILPELFLRRRWWVRTRSSFYFLDFCEYTESADAVRHPVFYTRDMSFKNRPNTEVGRTFCVPVTLYLKKITRATGRVSGQTFYVPLQITNYTLKPNPNSTNSYLDLGALRFGLDHRQASYDLDEALRRGFVSFREFSDAASICRRALITLGNWYVFQLRYAFQISDFSKLFLTGPDARVYENPAYRGD